MKNPGIRDFRCHIASFRGDAEFDRIGAQRTSIKPRRSILMFAMVVPFPARVGRGRNSLPPHLIRDIDGELQFGPLLFLGEEVALLGRGEAALRGYRELIQRRVF
jgi:hypothetical protein